MCGICGFAGFEDKALLRSMVNLLRHRGPDDSGMYADKKISLGHTRLSIVDLSSAGHQPMCNDAGTLWISFNGEVYNHKALRAELESRGYSFKSNTDTEVVLKAYEAHGQECIHLFNGMFAFAIWNSESKELFLARDRLGIKPLYYTVCKDSLLFASEIKPLLLYEHTSREVDYGAVSLALSFRYVPSERTLFKAIFQIPPGCFAFWRFGNKEAGKLEIKKYWKPFFSCDSKDSFETSVKKTEKLLKSSIEMRKNCDVPFGAYLSGGLDSSLIVAYLSRFVSEPVKTFSISFGDDPSSEHTDARQVSEHFRTDHEEIIVDRDISQLFPEVVWRLEAPHSPITVPLLLLSRHASKKVKVVLSGDGADETFMGYLHHRNLLLNRRLKSFFPSFLSKAAAKSVGFLPVRALDFFFNYPESMGDAGRQRLQSYLSNLNDPYAAYTSFVINFSKEEQGRLFTPRMRRFVADPKSFLSSAFSEQMPKEFLFKMLSYELKNWLPYTILLANDKLTMASSIEGRVPFLDHFLVEHASRIKYTHNTTLFRDKQVLRKIGSKVLPKEIFKKKKHAFHIPLDAWLSKNGVFERVFSSKSIMRRGIYSQPSIKKLMGSYKESKLLRGRQLGLLLSVELWFRLFVDHDPTKLSKNALRRVVDN